MTQRLLGLPARGHILHQRLDAWLALKLNRRQGQQGVVRCAILACELDRILLQKTLLFEKRQHTGALIWVVIQPLDSPDLLDLLVRVTARKEHRVVERQQFSSSIRHADADRRSFEQGAILLCARTQRLFGPFAFQQCSLGPTERLAERALIKPDRQRHHPPKDDRSGAWLGRRRERQPGSDQEKRIDQCQAGRSPFIDKCSRKKHGQSHQHPYSGLGFKGIRRPSLCNQHHE